MKAMHKLKQKSKFRIVSACCVVVAVGSYAVSKVSPDFFELSIVALLLFLASGFLNAIGSDYSYSADEIHIGFTHIKRGQAELNVSEDEDFVSVKTEKKIYLLKSWMFEPHSWHSFTDSIKANTPEQGAAANP